MKVQIEVGKGILCDGIEIMFGNSISSVVKAVGEVDNIEKSKLDKFNSNENDEWVIDDDDLPF